MNTTELYIAAGTALETWFKDQSETPVLYIENGHVVCRECPKGDFAKLRPLSVTSTTFQDGLTLNQWDAIGKALETLFCEEKVCQSHQKH